MGNRPVFLPWVVILGFLRLTTRPSIAANPLSIAEACEIASSWLARPQVSPLHPGDHHGEILFALLRIAGTGGNLTTDAHLAGECDLVAKARILDDEAGFLYVGSGLFARDRRGQPPITAAALQSLATESGRPVTYTCVPPGSGVRIGLDRDGDGSWDGDERQAQTDPADPDSGP